MVLLGVKDKQGCALCKSCTGAVGRTLQVFGNLVFAVAVCVSTHEPSVAFCSLFSLMLPGGHTLAFQNVSFHLLLTQL